MKNDSFRVVYGEEEFSVKEAAQKIFSSWESQYGDLARDVIDATASNSSQALEAINKLITCVESQPLFGGCRLVWFKNCNFLGEDRTGTSKNVTEHLTDLVARLKSLNWENLRLLVSAEKISKRKPFYKGLSDFANFEEFAAIPAEKDWEGAVIPRVQETLSQRGKKMSPATLNKLLLYVGANVRQIHSEVEKLCLYVGDREEITSDDIEMMVTRNKIAKSFALTTAIGERNLSQAIKLLDEELAMVQTDKDRSEIGILSTIISKVRLMLQLRLLIGKGFLSTGGRMPKFDIPEGLLPEDKRLNPSLQNPWAVKLCIPHAMKYSEDELIRAMEILMDCYKKLVYSGGDPHLALQQAVMAIVK